MSNDTVQKDEGGPDLDDDRMTMMISIPCTISDQQASVQHQTRNLSYTARRLRVLGRPGPRPGSSRI